MKTKRIGFLLLGLILAISCSKDEPTPSQDTNDGLYDIKATDAAGMVYLLRDETNNVEMAFFGTRNSSNVVNSIASATLRKLSGSDTVYHFLFDKSQRVKALFTSTSTGKLPHFIKLSYAADFINVTALQVNWTTGVIGQKESVLVNAPIMTLKKIIGGRVSSPEGVDLAKLAYYGSAYVIGILTVTEAVVALAGGAAIAIPAIAIYVGAKFIAKGLTGFEAELEKHETTALQVFLPKAIDLIFPSAAAAEIERPANSPTDPALDSQPLYASNPQLGWCEHTVVFDYKYWPYYISGNKVIHYGSLDPASTCCSKDVNKTIQKPNKTLPSCNGPSSDTVLGTRSFMLMPGKTITYTYDYQTAICENTSVTYSVTLEFDCPE